MHAEHLVNELVNYHCPTRRRKRNQSDASDWFRLRLKSSASEWFHNLPRRRRLIPQTFFHTKTRSRKHFFIEKPYPANSFFAKSCIPQTLFIPKPYPANSFSRKRSGMQFWGNSNIASDNIIIITKCKYTCSGVAPVRAGSSGVIPILRQII